MSREEIISETIEKLNFLTDAKLEEVADYVSFITSRIEDKILNQGIKVLASNSKSFDFLNQEEELYQIEDIIEKYK